MSWKRKMYILSNLLGQVNRLSPVEFLLQREGIDRQRGLKFVQTGHASQANTYTETTGGEETATGEAHVQFILQGGTRVCVRLFQFQEAGILDAFNMKGATLWNLAQMNLHERTLHVKRRSFNAQVRPERHARVLPKAILARGHVPASTCEARRTRRKPRARQRR